MCIPDTHIHVCTYVDITGIQLKTFSEYISNVSRQQTTYATPEAKWPTLYLEFYQQTH